MGSLELFTFKPYLQTCFSLYCVGVNAISNAEESFLRRYTINEDFRNMNATIEVHLTSIDMLVSVRLDTRNRITSVTTTYLPGKTDPNEVSTESGRKIKPKVVTDQTQQTQTNEPTGLETNTSNMRRARE